MRIKWAFALALLAAPCWAQDYGKGRDIIYTPPGLPGGGSVSAPIYAPAADNCAAVPYSFTSDTNTGVCSSAADTVGFITGGTTRFSLTTTAVTSTLPILPTPTDAVDFGQDGAFWKTIYVARSIQGSKSKTLVDATATAFVRIAIPQSIATNYKGGSIIYEIYCDDDTNQASQSGMVKFTCHNRAGTEACGFGTPDGVTLGDGTASLGVPTFDASSSVADTIDLRVSSDCTGITPNTHTIEYRLDMPTAATLTPQ